MAKKLSDLVCPVEERNPDPGATILSVSESHGIVPQSRIFRKQIATSDRANYKRVQRGDLVFNPYLLWNRAVGACFEPEGGCVSPAYVVLRPRHPGTTRFLHYFFRSSTLTDAVDCIASGSVTRRRTAPLSEILELEFVLPDVRSQQRSNELLTTLDDKIELNRKMNETLEAIAHAIFKSWFVDFDPVRAKMEGRKPACMDAATAALFPDSFEDSELGEIPNGWKAETIRDRTRTIQYGLTRSACPDRIGPRFLRITDIRGGRVDWRTVPYCHLSPDEHDAYRLQHGDVLVARTGASTGENTYIVAPPDSVFASYLVRFQFPDLALARFVGEYMRTTAYFDFVAGCIGGSAQPNASAQVLASAPMIFPPPDITKSFANVVSPLDHQRASLAAQSSTLTRIRDALLPKLISGEVRAKPDQ